MSKSIKISNLTVQDDSMNVYQEKIIRMKNLNDDLITQNIVMKKMNGTYCKYVNSLIVERKTR